METDGGRSKFTRAVSTRTLTDVIHDEPDGGDPKEELRGWKHFKEKIRSHGRRAGSGGGGAAWTSSVAVPASDVAVQKRVMFRHASGRVSAAPESDPGMLQGAEIGAVQQDFLSSSLRRNSSGRNERSGRFDSDPSPLRRLQEEEAEEEREGGGGAGEGEEAPVKMSLMSLLAENDDEYGMEEYEEEEEEEEDGGGANINCSICMVRHKGEAFDPCGHSFCRLCSREMWVQGGNCPLCNNYVLEILDIF
ncbi:LON peptidase N-terminal domain and RING finger protein 1-like [Salvia divinorum]|uniref:LON peptidase N-terminal domain and RING finger protein 1-like n=1 Tax=Salvia divinorum TaxID=28513 RepID=A0ABD1IAJ4_SALDI